MINETKNDTFFYSLVPNHWSTGILYIGNFPLDKFTGEYDTIVTSITFRDVLFEIIHNSLFANSTSPLKLINIDTLFIKAHQVLNQQGILPLGVINIKYNRIRSCALDSAYVIFENGKLKENTTNNSLIYEEKRLVLIAPLIDFIKENILLIGYNSNFVISNLYDSVNIKLINSNNTSKVLNASLSTENLLFNNYNQAQISFSIIRNGQEMSGTFSANIIRITSQDPQIYFSGYINDPPNLIGLATFHYGCGNTSGTIRKPFVFVEGFDPGLNAGEMNNFGRLNWEIFSNWTNWINNLPTSQKDLDHDNILDYQNLEKGKKLIDRLNTEGFDVIYLDFKNSTRDIRENARVLISLLNYINQYKTTHHKIILAGGSMGGLVTKIALNKLYQDFPTNKNIVRDWITFDSPLEGANIPLGDQFFVKYFSSSSSDANWALSVLNTTAAQEMLKYHYLDYYSSRTIHADFISDVLNIYPPLFVRKKIAISNGSNKGINGHQGFGWGAQMVDMVGSCQGDVIQFRGTAKTWAVPANDNNFYKIFEGHIQQCITFDDISTQEVYAINCRSIDNSPGGMRYTNKSLVYPGGTAYYPNHCFIPTLSALGIDEDHLFTQGFSTNFGDLFYNIRDSIFLNPYYNFIPDPNVCYLKNSSFSSISPFDILYAPDNNQQHVEITDDNINFIMNEIAPSDLYLQNETYPLHNLPSDADQFEARNSITAGRNVTPKTAIGNFVVNPNATITFRAGDKIVLKDGFSTKAGATFRAYIEPFDCPPVQRLSSSNYSSDSKASADNSSITLNSNTLVYPHHSSNNNITLFPNPTSSLVHLQLPIHIKNSYTLKITNLLGQPLSLPLQKLSDTMISIDFSDIPEGVYIVHYSDSEGNVFTNKVVVKR